ncbi:MAG TPA: hypothetical protein VKD91_21150 [Pyrinomonadaceae bacterium]|nr:hypothetical protein [Pyrinomonadaceae bacterium]
MQQLSRFRIIFVVLVSALFGACTQQPQPAEPKFAGRLLLLSGAGANGADLTELTAAGTTYNLSVLTKGIFEAVPSPDQTQLLYATKDEVLVRDLRSGAVKSLVKGTSFCLSWAPDGKHFSYKQTTNGTQTRLFAADLDGKAKLIWEDSFSAGERSAGAFGCAYWIAPDHLVFDRLLGAAPNQKKGGEAPKPNTTTLAVLGSSVKLSDTERKWSIETVCQAGSGALLRPHDQGQPFLAAKSLADLKTLDPKPISCSDCRFMGFAAKSCVPFFLEQNESTSTDVFSLNPVNWQRQRGGHINQIFSPNARGVVKSSARLMVVGDAPDKLYLIDTESGAIVAFFPHPPPELKSPVPIMWIEN